MLRRREGRRKLVSRSQANASCIPARFQVRRMPGAESSMLTAFVHR